MSRLIKSLAVFVFAIVFLLLLLPGLMGRMVDRMVDHTLHDMKQQGIAAYHVVAYHRGWFRSRLLVADAQGHTMALGINHGPLLYHHHIGIGLAELYDEKALGHFGYHFTVTFKLHGGAAIVVQNSKPITTRHWQAKDIEYYFSVRDLQHLDQLSGHLKGTNIKLEPAHTHAEYHIQSMLLDFKQRPCADCQHESLMAEDRTFALNVFVNGMKAHLGEHNLHSTPYQLDIHAMHIQNLVWHHVERWLVVLKQSSKAKPRWSDLLLQLINKKTQMGIRGAAIHVKTPTKKIQLNGDLHVRFNHLPVKHDWLDVLLLSDKSFKLDAYDWKTKSLRLAEADVGIQYKSHDAYQMAMSLENLRVKLHPRRNRAGNHQPSKQPPVVIRLSSMDGKVRSMTKGNDVTGRSTMRLEDLCIVGIMHPAFCIKKLKGVSTVKHAGVVLGDSARYAMVKAWWQSAIARWQSQHDSKKPAKPGVTKANTAKVIKPMPYRELGYTPNTTIESELSMETTLFNVGMQSTFRPIDKAVKAKQPSKTASTLAYTRGTFKADITVSRIKDAMILGFLEHAVKEGYAVKAGKQFHIPVLASHGQLKLNNKVWAPPARHSKKSTIVPSKARHPRAPTRGPSQEM